MRRRLIPLAISVSLLLLAGCLDPVEDEDIAFGYDAGSGEVCIHAPDSFVSYQGVPFDVVSIEAYLSCSVGFVYLARLNGTELCFQAPQETTWRVFVILRGYDDGTEVTQVAYNVTKEGSQLRFEEIVPG